MNKILIENYRGFDIEFDTDNEKFQCIITDGMEKESKSFGVVKKFVDEYKKNNQDFNPFNIVMYSKFNHTFNKYFKVVGIRKDGRFIYEDGDGNKGFISKYSEGEFIISKECNDEIIQSINEIHEQKNTALAGYTRRINSLAEQLTIVSLKEYGKTLK